MKWKSKCILWQRKLYIIEKCGLCKVRWQSTKELQFSERLRERNTHTNASAFYWITVMGTFFDICSYSSFVFRFPNKFFGLKANERKKRSEQYSECKSESICCICIYGKIHRVNRSLLVFLRVFYCTYAYLRRCSTNPRD